MTKLLLILFFGGVLTNALAARSEPPLLIDAQPSPDSSASLASAR